MNAEFQITEKEVTTSVASIAKSTIKASSIDSSPIAEITVSFLVDASHDPIVGSVVRLESYDKIFYKNHQLKTTEIEVKYKSLDNSKKPT